MEVEQDTVFSLRRRLNTLENERINVISASNEEVSRLSSRIATLTAQLERGEAVRQNLEYELVRARKDAAQAKNDTEQKDEEMRKLVEDFERKEEKYLLEKRDLFQDLNVVQTAAQEDVARLSSALLEKEKQASALLEERGLLESEKKRLLSNVSVKQRSIEELKAEIGRSAASKQEQSTSLKLKTQELGCLKEKISMLEQELVMALKKIESLENAKEVERTSHLQTKYNYELLQKETRSEKAAKADAILKLENLQASMKRLQESLDDEKLSASKQQEKLLALEKDLENVSKQLTAEMLEKKQLTKSYSQQLEECQKTANQMKQELLKAKKKQTQLDVVYTSGSKELQEILVLFSKTVSTSSPPSATPPILNKDSVSTKSFIVLVSGIRQMFNDYQQQHERLANELSNQQLLVDQLTKDCKSYKIKISTSAKASQVTNEALEKLRKEQKQQSVERQQLEEDQSRLQKELASLKENLTKEQSCSQKLRDQIKKVSTKFHDDKQRSSTFVQLLHQLLNTVDGIRVVQEDKGATVDGATMHSWNDLGLVVNEQVSNLIKLWNKEKEEISRLEELLRQKERMLEQLYLVHDEELTKMARMYESTSQQWTVTKEEIQKQYSKKLAEAHTKHKTSSDETREKFELAFMHQHELKQQCSRLEIQLSQSLRYNNALLATCALLCGIIYPLHSRCLSLSRQRKILDNQLGRFDSFKNQVKSLIQAISKDSPESSIRRPSLAPKLRFRVAVVAIVALCRLRSPADNGYRMFTLYNVLPDVYGTVVWCGNAETTIINGTRGSVSGRGDGAGGVSDWLSSDDLRATIQSSMGDLVTAVSRQKEGVSGYSNTRLVNIAKSCFQKFLSSMLSVFPRCSAVSSEDLAVPQLSRGLEMLLGRYTLPNLTSYESSQKLSKDLQKELLKFTQRLHTAELERQDAHSKLLRLRQGTSLGGQDETTEQLETQLTSLKDQLEKSVPLEKFTQVCDELARTLGREEQLLQAQKEQLKELNKHTDTRLNQTITLHQTKELEPVDPGKQNLLSDLKVELNSKDQLIQRLTRQIRIIDEEKTSLLDKIADAERALHTASRDKQAIIAYTSNVAECLRKMSSAELDKCQTDAVLCLEIPTSKPSVELLAIRSLLAAFVDTQKHTMATKGEIYDPNNGAKQMSKEKADQRNQTKSMTTDTEVAPHGSKMWPVSSALVDASDKELLVSTNVPSANKGNQESTKLTQGKAVDRKPKSKLPRHQGSKTSTRRMTSHRYSSMELVKNFVAGGERHSVRSVVLVRNE